MTYKPEILDWSCNSDSAAHVHSSLISMGLTAAHTHIHTNRHRTNILKILSMKRTGHTTNKAHAPELEFLKSLWGLRTEEEEGYRTGPPG
jgi:hypothetical protein